MSDILVHKRQIVILWDNDKMDAEVGFKHEEFPTFEGILAVLEIAKLKTQNMQRMAQMAQFQQAQMQAMQEAQVASQLGKGRRGSV